MPRKKRGKLEKLVYGLANLGKYPALGVMAASLGCVVGPNSISVSDDGRYLAVPVGIDREGRTELAFCNNNLERIALVDLQTEDIRYFDVENPRISWLKNTGESVAFTYGDSEKTNIKIISGGNEVQIIENAGFGDFSPDGNKFAYTSIHSFDYGRMRKIVLPIGIRDLNTGEVEYPGIFGIALDFSPDGNRLLTIGMNLEGDEINLGVYDIKNKDRMKVYEFQEGESLRNISEAVPRWIDDNRILFNVYGKKYGRGGELFIGNINGEIEQITFNNDETEVLPSLLPNGEIGFLRDDERNKHDMGGGMLWSGRKTEQGWSYGTRGILSMGYLPVGDKIVYCGEPPDELRDRFREDYGLYLIDLNDRENIVNLGRVIIDNYRESLEE